MPILHLFCRSTIERAPNLPLDPELRELLASRVVHLSNQGLLDMTELLVIDRETVEREIVAALGFSPLDGLTGVRFGRPGFCTALDYAARVSPNYQEAIITVGNSGFAFQLLVRDDADPALVALCAEMAA